MDIKQCANCGNDFSVETIRIDTRYCSTRCKDEHNNKIKSVRRKESSAISKIREIQQWLEEESNPEIKKELKIAVTNIHMTLEKHWLTKLEEKQSHKFRP